jgi:hypothetical protein
MMHTRPFSCRKRHDAVYLRTLSLQHASERQRDRERRGERAYPKK